MEKPHVLILTESPEEFKNQLTALSKNKSNPYLSDVDKLKLMDYVSTDAIIRICDLLTDDEDNLGDCVLLGLPKIFGITRGLIKNLHPQILISGKSFGMGSSREQAVTSLMNAGVKTVFAKSFGPIFRANAINSGLQLVDDAILIRYIKERKSIPKYFMLKNIDNLEKDIIKKGGLIKFLRSSKNLSYKTKNLNTKGLNIFQKHLKRIIKRKRKDTLPEYNQFTVNCAYSYVPLSIPARLTIIKHFNKIKNRLGGENVYFFEDHFSFSDVFQMKRLTGIQRKFAAELNIPEQNYFRGLKEEGGGIGICHRIMLEKINPKKHKIVIATDSHTPTLGALPVLAIPVGSTQLAGAISTGKIPINFNLDVTRVELSGQLPAGLTIRDAQLEMASKFSSFDKTRIIEYGGPGLRTLSFDQVTALCNMIPEIFLSEIAVCEFFPDAYRFLHEKYGFTRKTVEHLYPYPDKNTVYKNILSYNLTDSKPWIAFPGNPQNTNALSDVFEFPKINKAYLASCTNTLFDIGQAAAVLKDRHIDSNVLFLVVAGSKTIYDAADKAGYLEILKSSGAIISETSSCNVCMGDGPYVLQKNDIAISATNRNFPGRMGHPLGQAYLAGPIITSLSAMIGKIASLEDWTKELPRITKNLKNYNLI